MKGNSIIESLSELKVELDKLGASEESYYLQGIFGSTNDENKRALSIRSQDGILTFEVYYKEYGEKHSVRKFTSSKEAFTYFIGLVRDDLILERLNEIDGLSEMSLDERLKASDLKREYEQCLQSNRTRAKHILRWLKVDESEIKFLLYASS